MGLTQHRNGVQNVQMLVNLLHLRGNIGKPGAGICPVRGHSNVQGQRTVGVTEKPELAPLDKLKALYGFEPPRTKGVNTGMRPGARCRSPCRSRPGSTAATSCTARRPTSCPARAASRSTARPAASKPVAAAQRKWNTPTGKANFTVPDTLSADPDMPVPADALRLFTVRSDGQFNTTIYSLEDRFRGVHGRKVLFMAEADMALLGLADGDIVTASTAVDDGAARKVEGLTVVEYGVPAGCVAGYYPECNTLIPLWHYAKDSKVPAAKSIAIRVERTGGSGRPLH
jgi:anaerobic selenocysteine-containing dehydrogenase